MDESTKKVLLAILPAAIGALLGYLLKYYLDKKQQITSDNTIEKRKAYQDFVNLYVDLMNDSTVSTAPTKLREFYKKYMLYGSPSVIKSLAELLQFFYKEPKLDSLREQRHAMKKIARVFKTMRSDIGLSNYTLGHNGELLMRAIIKDYDHIMTPRWILRSKAFINSALNQLSGKARKDNGNQSVRDDSIVIEKHDSEPEIRDNIPHPQNSKKSNRKKRRK